MPGNDDLVTYIFRGNEGESVPQGVEKLIVNPGVRVLPRELCFNMIRLRQVTLPKGLTRIDGDAFLDCTRLLEIKVSSTVRFIGQHAFSHCTGLTTAEFEMSQSSPHQLQTIEGGAFISCESLQRIKLPASVIYIGGSAFKGCNSLIGANLSTTCVKQIPFWTFANCRSMQTISLPNTLRSIFRCAFSGCSELVTVVIPLDSPSISIGDESFAGCRQLANLVLPKGSTAGNDSFYDRLENESQPLRNRYGKDSARLVAGLITRFDDFPVHRPCYDHSTITDEQLQQCIEEQETDLLLVDEFGMTPFHVLFSTIGPCAELLQVLLNTFPYFVLGWKDVNGKRPMDYLVKNWTDGATTTLLFQMSLQKWMIDPINRWGAASWEEKIKSKVSSLLLEGRDEERRANLWTEVCSSFEHYEMVESSSVVELALWKAKLRSGRRSDSSKRQALDRGECRCVSGADVVIPNVLKFLDLKENTALH